METKNSVETRELRLSKKLSKDLSFLISQYEKSNDELGALSTRLYRSTKVLKGNAYVGGFALLLVLFAIWFI